MDVKQVGLYVQIGSIVAGIVTALFVVKTHPVPVLLLAIEAGVYFVGDYLRKL